MQKGIGATSAQGLTTAIVLVVFAIISSIISVGYYFKLIIAMYSKEPAGDKQEAVPFAYRAVAVIAIVLNLAIGFYPDLILSLIRRTMLIEQLFLK